MIDIKKIRKDFPILKRKINGKPLVYFDNAASSQKPIQVLKAMDDYYLNHNANINRGVHTLAEESTDMYDKSREKIASFINAYKSNEIIFTRNSTEAINLIAYSWGRANIREGDEIITTMMEHHSDIVPWQILASEKKAKLLYIPFDEKGQLDLFWLKAHVSPKTKITAVVHISNALGTINDVFKISEIVKKINPKTLVLVDGSQSAPHIPVDVQKLGCDFFAFTGHKMLGPMGTGVLWGREEILNSMPPFLGGGDMIREVFLDHSTWNDLPEKFEAGTPNVAGAVGLAAAVDYLIGIGMKNIREHERELTGYALSVLGKIKDLTIIGPNRADERGGLVAFYIKDIHAHDVAQVLDQEGIAVRSGHHCTMPLHLRIGIIATTRASFNIYNTKEEIDYLGIAIKKVIKKFGV